MKMPGQNEESLILLRNQLGNLGIDAIKKKMFGHETYFLNGHMFAGVFGENIFLHVGEEKVNAEAGKNGLGHFEAMGKKMKSYLTLEKQVQNDTNLSAWLQTAEKYLMSLPLKKPKVRKPRKKK